MNNLRDMTQKFKILKDITIYENEQMAKRFSFKVGGTTPILIEPLTEDAFLEVLNLCQIESVPYFILGGGTNIVFSDDGFNGVVISTVKLNKIEMVSNLKDDFTILRCQCGVQMNMLVNYATKNLLSGIEQFCGLPGTIGGACYMNARCFDLEISDVIGKIEYLTLDKEKNCRDDLIDKNLIDGASKKNGANSLFVKKTLLFDKNLWNYKISPFTDTQNVILSAEFKVRKESKENGEKIQQKAASYMKERVEKGHFKFPCAGSVFKNNRLFGKPTGQLIDEIGLKGKSIGGAQIAPWHGNIIINRDNATQKDILELVKFIQNEVKSKLGYDLEPEIIFK